MLKLILPTLMLAFGLNAGAEVIGYACAGTEPFWNMTVKNGKMTFAMLGENQFSVKVQGPMNAQGMQAGFASVYRSAKNNNVLSVLKGTCSDNMSDQESAFSAVLLTKETVYTGCCEEIK